MFIHRSLIASLLAFGTSVSHANSNSTPMLKSGFNIGAGIGYSRIQASQKTNISPDADIVFLHDVRNEDILVNKSTSHIIPQLSIGYDYIHGKLFTGLELDYRFNPSQISGSTNSVQKNYYGLCNPYIMKLKHRHDFGLSLRAGGLVTPQFAVYAIGNVRFGKFKQELNLSADTIYTPNNTFKSRTLFGYGGGLGVKYALPYNMAISLDATCDIYRKMHITQNASKHLDQQSVTTSTKSPRIFNALFKISKTF